MGPQYQRGVKTRWRALTRRWEEMVIGAYRQLIGPDEERAVNQLSPGDLLYKIGSRMRVLEQHSEIVLRAEIQSDATGGVGFDPFPFDFELIQVYVHGTSTNAGGKVTVQDKDGNAITDPIAMASKGTVDKATTIDQTYAELETGNKIVLVTANAGDRGIVFILGRRAGPFQAPLTKG